MASLNILPPELKLAIAQRIEDSDAAWRSLRERSILGTAGTPWAGWIGRSMQAMSEVNHDWRVLINPHLFEQVFPSLPFEIVSFFR